MDNQTLQQITGEIATLVTILSPLALALFGAYKAQLHKYVQAKIDTIQDDNLRKVATDTLDRVDKIATNVITNIDVNIKPAIIEDIKKGSMTRDDLVNLKSIAKDNILKQMTKDSRIALGDTVGDMNSYLETLIEAKLAELKIDTTSPVSKTEITMPTKEEIDNDSLRNQLSQAQAQLQQVQADKDSISQQLSQFQEAKRQADLSWQEMSNQVSALTSEKQQLETDKQVLQSKLDSITQVVQPVATQSVIDNNVQAQADVNGITTNTVQ